MRRHGSRLRRDQGRRPAAVRRAVRRGRWHVLTFDYRGFGTSEGTLRQDVDHRRHREDYHSALAYVRSRPDVDPARIACGEAVLGRPRHRRGRPGPGRRGRHQPGRGDGRPGRAVRRQGDEWRREDDVADRRRAARPRPAADPPVAVPGPGHGSARVGRRHLRAGREEGYQAILGPTFRNEMCARGILRIALNRPVRYAAKVPCPVMLVAAEHDNIAPVASAASPRSWATARRAAVLRLQPLRHLRRGHLRDEQRGAGRVPPARAGLIR